MFLEAEIIEDGGGEEGGKDISSLRNGPALHNGNVSDVSLPEPVLNLRGFISKNRLFCPRHTYKVYI